MKRYEKILLLIFAGVFVLQLLAFIGKVSLFFLTTWVLTGSYLVAGYWLFNSKESRHVILSILAGVALSLTIFALPSVVLLNTNSYFDFFPVANGLLFIYLGFYLVIKRKSGPGLKSVKLLFVRSAVFLALSAFFTYTPVSFVPYRKIVYVLNNGNEYLQSNLRMFDYSEACQDAIKTGDCERAIENGLKEIQAGRFWLGLEEEPDKEDTKRKAALARLQNETTATPESITNSHLVFINEPDLWKICGTYSDVYEAYKCKADDAYEREKYDEALRSFVTAHFYLNACEHQNSYWNLEKAWSLNNIAHCYRKLGNYAYADSLFVNSIKQYEAVNDSADFGLAQLFSNFAFSLSDEANYTPSVRLFRVANAILRKDTVTSDSREAMVSNYLGMTENYLRQDSLRQALFFAKRAMHFSGKTKENASCKTALYYGVCLFRLNDYRRADSVLKTTLACYEQQPGTNVQMAAECNLVLGQVNIALARYEKAKAYLKKGMEITATNYGPASSRYANYMKVQAYLSAITGDYAEAEKQYTAVIGIYGREHGSRNNKLPDVLSELAGVNISLSDIKSAKANSDSALAIGAVYLSLTNPSNAGILNTAAYVSYCSGLFASSDTLYNKVIVINSNYGLGENAATADALNGLGLTATARRKFPKADSLFANSLLMHQHIYSDNHPLTATVYLNFGKLLIEQGRLTEAEEKIRKALQINTSFFKSDHDVFGDIFVALGDLAKKKKQNDIARENYTKALAIYRAKFDETHWKVNATQAKL